MTLLIVTLLVVLPTKLIYFCNQYQLLEIVDPKIFNSIDILRVIINMYGMPLLWTFTGWNKVTNVLQPSRNIVDRKESQAI